MIRVRVELLPGGVGEPELLGEAFIANDLADSLESGGRLGSYKVRLMKAPRYASRPGVWKTGQVRGFDRVRRGPWDLLYLALAATVGQRNRVGGAAEAGEGGGDGR